MDSLNTNPLYIRPLGAGPTLSKPPFDLSQVMMRVFPLRANYHSLQLFCDRFLNIAPEYSRVEPAAPFVLFCVINYGHMSNVASNVGYTSQNEVIFAVPLNWYRKVNDEMVLQNNASISPFIWVDKPLSAWVGREVYGWPKSIAWLKGGVNEWARDPTAPQTLFSLEALLYRRLFSAERQEPGVLLEVQRKTPPGIFEFPPSTMNPLNPWLAWPRGVLETIGVGGSLLETFTRLPTFGFPSWGDGANILEMMSQTFGAYNPFGAMPASNTLNLKQFRDPSHPQSVSYQAIVNSEMTPKSYRRGGLLGESGLLRGELSGGYQVLVHRYPAWPIIDALGLRVSRETRGEGRRVAVLEPVMPFWVELDYEYGKGEVVCWRTSDSHWKLPPNPSPQPVPKETDSGSSPMLNLILPTVPVSPGKQDERARDFAEKCTKCGSPHLYNTAEGSAVEQVYGPFFFPDATIRVLPLLADWDRLRQLTDRTLNFPDVKGETALDDEGELEVLRVPPGASNRDDQVEQLKREHRLGMPLTVRTPSGNLFVPWGRYVYLTVANYEEMSSGLNIGWWARRRVAYSYPVKWYQWVDDRVVDGSTVEGHWELKSFGMVSPFMYVDTPTAATVGQEMNGWSVAEARIESPETDWLVKADGSAAPNLMSLETDVVPALNADQEAVSRLLMEITTELPTDGNDDRVWKEIASLWGERQIIEARTKALEALPAGDPFTKHGHFDSGWPPRRRLQWLKSTAMEVLFRGLPFNLISMKQFRDAQEPDDACYQAINVYPESITRAHEIRPIEQLLYVGIHRYPTAPIVDTLGLDVKWTDNAHGQPIQYLQAIRPFWIRADVKAELGRDVAYRAGSLNWTAESGVNNLYFDLADEPATPVYAATLADREPEAVQDFGSERIFHESLKLAEAMYGDRGEWAITRGGHWDQLREPRVSFAPQIAIESILNHRWVNFDPTLRDTTLDPDAAWATLIPTASIPNETARQWFVENYEQFVQCFERVYDRVAEPDEKRRSTLKGPSGESAPLPPVRELAGFLQGFELTSDVELLRQRDTRKTAQKLYEQRLLEIEKEGGGTGDFVRKIQAEFQEQLGTIEASSFNDFFRKLEACLSTQSLTKQELMAEVAGLWRSIGSTDSLRVLTEGDARFWAVNPTDLSRIQYMVPPDERQAVIEERMNETNTALQRALDAQLGGAHGATDESGSEDADT